MTERSSSNPALGGLLDPRPAPLTFTGQDPRGVTQRGSTLLGPVEAAQMLAAMGWTEVTITRQLVVGGVTADGQPWEGTPPT